MDRHLCILLLLAIAPTLSRGQGTSLVTNGGFEVDDSTLFAPDTRNLNDQALIIDYDLLPGWRAYDDNEPEYRTIELAYNGSTPTSQDYELTLNLGRTSLYYVTGTHFYGGRGAPLMLVGELQKPLVQDAVYTVSMDVLLFGSSALDSTFAGVDVWFFQDTLDLFRQIEARSNPTLFNPMEVHYETPEEIGFTVGEGKSPPGQWHRVTTRFYPWGPHTIFTLGMLGRTAVQSQLPPQVCLIDNFSIEPVLSEQHVPENTLPERPHRRGRKE